MRKLKTSDLFACCRLLKAIGIKDEVEKITRSADKLADVEAKGFELLYGIFDKATESASEKQIYAFLAGPFEMTVDEVENLPIAELIEKIKQLAEENNLVDFFKSVGKLKI